jgi:hypothetical protein
MNESKDDINTAIEKARNNFTPLKQTGKAQYGNYHTMQDIMTAVGDALTAQGVFMSFETKVDTSGAMPLDIFVAKLIHVESNTKRHSEIILKDMNKGPQGTGGSITYMRRYTLQLMLNLSPDANTEDDGDWTSTGKRRSI